MERKPLKTSVNSSGHAGSVFRQTSFRLIIGCLLFVTIIITFALILTHVTSDGFYLINTEVAVVSDNAECDHIGLNLIKRGGSAVDAIVATQLCLGLIYPHLTGIGGVGIMVIYNHLTTKSSVVDFMGNPQNPLKGSRSSVPAVLKGLQAAHDKYGKLPWLDVVLPVAQLAGRGFPMSESLHDALMSTRFTFKNLNLFLFPNGTMPESGKRVYWEEMARTLEQVAKAGPQDFYTGEMAQQFIKSLPENTLTLEDLSSYSSKELQPLYYTINGWQVITPSNSLGGLEIHNSLNLFNKINFTVEEEDQVYFQQLSQVLKTMLNSTNSVSGNMADWKGVSAVAVDGEELVVALVSGLGGIFGSAIMGHGDITLNNAAAVIPELTRTMSGMAPVIFFKEGEICGSRGAIASTDYRMSLQVLMHVLRDKPLAEAITMPRFQISETGAVTFEASKVSYPDISELMSTFGNKTEKKSASVNALIKVKDEISFHRDRRFDN